MRRSSRKYLMRTKCSATIRKGEDMIWTGHLVAVEGRTVTHFQVREGNHQGLMEALSHESSSTKPTKTFKGSLVLAGSASSRTPSDRANKIPSVGEGPSIETVEATITNSIATQINTKMRKGVGIPTNKKTSNSQASKSSFARCRKTSKGWNKRPSDNTSKSSNLESSTVSDTASMVAIRLTLLSKTGMPSKKSTHLAPSIWHTGS